MNGRLKYERGTGSLESEHTVRVKTDHGEEVIYGEHIVLAAGSRPRSLPNIQVDEHSILTSDGIESIDDYPKSLVIVGAGVIGCEYATIFSNFGKTKVYLIDRADRILPFEDNDISDMVSRNLEEQGVTIHHNASLVRLEKVGDLVEYELSYPDGRKEIIQVEKALLSVGRMLFLPHVEPQFLPY